MTREEAIQVLANFYVSTKNPKANHLCEAVYIAMQALKSEPKHGRWLKLYKANYKCSVCGSWWVCSDNNGIAIKDFKYCPNCGATMDEVEG